MAQRTGVPTMLFIAQRLCNLITKYTPVLTVLFPTNVALLAALAAANSACSVLAQELSAVREYGD
jgi:branched-subunit amino acid permease